jgi:hypothetical protein
VWRLRIAVIGLLACSACQRQPTLPIVPKAAPAEQRRAREDPIPVWVTALIKQQPAHSRTVIEESVYQGHRAFLVMPPDRAPDSGNEHVLHSDDGRIICEFGGFAGNVTVGSCDMDGIKFVQTLYPHVGS